MRMTTDEMLERMTTVLFFGGEWHARPQEGKLFYRGDTPREAMIRALAALPEPRGTYTGQPPVQRRRAAF